MSASPGHTGALALVPAPAGRLAAAVAARLGLRTSASLEAAVDGQLAALREEGCREEEAQLEARVRMAAEADPLLARMRRAVSVGETYFFRGPDQLRALVAWVQEHLLPARRASGRRLLRAWSAGCASGEEAYTLALLLRAAAPDFEVQVVGTDMNEAALEVARRAQYRARAVRPALPPEVAAGLERTAHGWQVSAWARRGVSFHPLNLVTGSLPAGVLESAPFDVVLLRNVLIYVDEPHVPALMRKVASVCGVPSVLGLTAAEHRAAAHAPDFADLAHALLVRQPPAERPPRPPPAPLHPERSPGTGRSRGATVTPSPLDSGPGRPPSAGSGQAAARGARVAQEPADAATLLALARAAADRGELAEAALLARQAASAAPDAPGPWYLLGLVAHAAGDASGAVAEFQRALFLERSHGPTALGLGLALEGAGRHGEARAQLEVARARFAALAPSALVEELGLSAQAALRLVEGHLSALGGTP